MTNFKINIDKPLPDSSQIRQHQNFDSLYEQYQVNARFTFWRNLYRNPRYFAGLAAVFAVLFLVYKAVEEERVMELAFVNPPVSNQMLVPYGSLEYLAQEPLSVETEAFQGLFVPANAFEDENGNLIEGSIELRFRTFYDAKSLAMAGIPMQYDSSQQLVSAGLIEVQAYQNGEVLRLREGVSLEVNMHASGVDSSFQLYYLDTEAKKWQERGFATEVPRPGPTLVRPEKPSLLAQIEQEEQNGAAKLVAAPFKPGKPFGVILKNKNAFPEFQPYEKTYWEYLAGAGSDNPWTSGLIGEQGDSNWEDVRVERLSGERYRLQFSRQKPDGSIESRQVVVRPLFEAHSQAEANTYYQRQLELFQQNLASWEQNRTERLKRQQLKQRLENEYQQALRVWMEQMNGTDGELATDTLTGPSSVLYQFHIDRLGVYQMAQLISRPAFNRAIWLTDSIGRPLGGSLLAAGKQAVLVPEGSFTLYRALFVHDSLYLPSTPIATLVLGTEEDSLAFVPAGQWQQASSEKRIVYQMKAAEGDNIPPLD